MSKGAKPHRPAHDKGRARKRSPPGAHRPRDHLYRFGSGRVDAPARPIVMDHRQAVGLEGVVEKLPVTAYTARRRAQKHWGEASLPCYLGTASVAAQIPMLRGNNIPRRTIAFSGAITPRHDMKERGEGRGKKNRAACQALHPLRGSAGGVGSNREKASKPDRPIRIDDFGGRPRGPDSRRAL